MLPFSKLHGEMLKAFLKDQQLVHLPFVTLAFRAKDLTAEWGRPGSSKTDLFMLLLLSLKHPLFCFIEILGLYRCLPCLLLVSLSADRTSLGISAMSPQTYRAESSYKQLTWFFIAEPIGVLPLISAGPGQDLNSLLPAAFIYWISVIGKYGGFFIP